MGKRGKASGAGEASVPPALSASERKETEIRLQGWSRQRRAVLLWRRVKGALAAPAMDEDGPPRLAFLDIGPSEEMWEYQVLATTLVEALESLASSIATAAMERMFSTS